MDNFLVDNPLLIPMYPAVQRAAEAFIKAAKALGFNLRVTSGYRSFQEQTALYAQGRTSPGPVVTNAKAGQSLHNYKVAFDVVDRLKGYNLTPDEWRTLGTCGNNCGFTWGGDFTTIEDKPHFEYLGGYMESDFFNNKVDYSRFD